MPRGLLICWPDSAGGLSVVIVTLIRDIQVRYWRNGNGSPGASLLSMPLGTGTVLDSLCTAIAGTGSRDVWIITEPGTAADGWDRELDDTGITIRGVRADDLGSRIHDLEPSDLLLIVDPQYWPTNGFELEAITRLGADYPGAVHTMAMGSDATGVVERVQCDESGNVQRVRRLYSGVTEVERHQGTIAYSTVRASAMEGVPSSTLSELRVTLARNNVLCQDVPLDSDLLDLTAERGFLALNEQVLAETCSRRVSAAYSRLAPGVLIGRGALIHESARIVAPVIVQPGARIERDATLIGPTLIGAGSSICRGAVIAQSVLPCETRVSSCATVRHCVSHPVVGASEAEEEHGERMMTMRAPACGRALSEIIAPDVDDVRTARSTFLAIKRVIDVVLSTALLIVLAPVFAVTAILIKLESRGPILFIHHRESVNGRTFPCFKFRTMRQDAHRLQRELYAKSMVDGPHFKIRKDPRVTRIGHLLRRTNIDELPQIVNVLLGHMSLVGPRPSPFRENQFCVPWRRGRRSVRPGLTGVGQICREYGAQSELPQWIYYDMR